MVTVNELVNMIKQAREGAEKRKFNQSVEVIITLKDIDVKKGFSLNEVVNLPHAPTRNATVCVVGSGDLALRARKAGADRVIEPEELDKLGTSKKEAKKVVRGYDFFVADTSLMASVGKALGQYLGPRGKMASPIPFNAPIDSIMNKFRSSVRVRSKAQLTAACRIGDETMSDQDLAENALAVVSAVEKKLPSAEKNVKGVMIKLAMGKTVKLAEAKVA
jgi:large subunit ribosomal protein L1